MGLVPRPGDPDRSGPILLAPGERTASLSSVAYGPIGSPRRAPTGHENPAAGIRP